MADDTHGERDRPEVVVSTGALRGIRDGDIDSFLGIPFAKPPFGERRFSTPEPPEPWEGARDASAFGPTAPQAPYGGGLEKYLPSVEIPGDDILTLNVWAPADRSGPLPVAVWVHGGALTRGTPALPTYDGERFARDGIVFVSVAYRLGQEGFAVADGVPPNLGLLDVQAALRWVRREIAAFGGDPGRVTAMGQSAGANLLAALLALPHAAELFDRVALQSGPLEAQPPKKAGRMTREVAKRRGIPLTRDGLAGQTPALLVDAQTQASAGGTPLGGGPTVALVVGGEVVPRPLDEAYAAGGGDSIPVLIGATSEEYRLWFLPSGALDRITTRTLTLARLAARVPAAVVRAHRRRHPDARPGEILGEIVGDMLLREPAYRLADTRLRRRAAPTWMYEFRWQSPLDGLGAAHVVDLSFVFDRLGTPDALALTGADAPPALAEAMHGAWVRFVLEGDPGWEAWDARRPAQVFDDAGGHIEYALRLDEIEALPARRRRPWR